jgi:Domain of unknown function (DUF3402)/N1221-like protein
MDETSESIESGEIRRIFVRADEVDTGTTILSPSKQASVSSLTSSNPSAPSSARPKAPARPFLREGSAPPPPPSQPPPAPPAFQPDPETLTDSLSLPQLRQIVAQFPKSEQRAYAFQYADAQDFATEVNEWFRYTEQDGMNLLASRDVFEYRWKIFCTQQSGTFNDEASWLDVEQKWRSQFVTDLLRPLQSQDLRTCVEALGCLCYIICGAWGLTAGLENIQDEHSTDAAENDKIDRIHVIQIEWMHKGVDLVVACKTIDALLLCLQELVDSPIARLSLSDHAEDEESGLLVALRNQALFFCFTCLYVFVESSRAREELESGRAARTALVQSQPNVLIFLVEIVSPSRWDETHNIPLTQALHLFWKAVLVLFGDITATFEDAQNKLQPKVDPFSAEASHPVLTASPLDYHLFRQEITSKYPAYNPPLPLVPLELEHKSMLPPLPHHPTKPDQIGGSVPGPDLNGANGSASIFHQPVHIATPAPSPPPSPVGPGGKQGKKQNYQTNQNFPFLYPPLDETSNQIGGKGMTQMQDLMVGKKWEGSDVPASIIEAGELFASRMRMTRAMRQLWMERDLFMKYDRGWRASEGELEHNSASEEVLGGNQSSTDAEEAAKISTDPSLKERLGMVEDFFHHALPNMQSLVIVMMKVMLSNVQDIALRNNSIQDQNGALNRSRSNPSLGQNQNSLPPMPPPIHPDTLNAEELDNVRSREISQKAISATIFLLTKWFKLSHVLKFEYLTQLLLDSNYLQLTLKYFAHQNIEDLVALQYDRDELSFFHFCHLNSDHPPLSPTSPQPESDAGSSEDEAMPPPIMRHRRSPITSSEPALNTQIASPEQMGGSKEDEMGDNLSMRPSVDELGNPIAPLPMTPITEFSFRQFQTSIHLLRVLQKVTRAKAHRILLLVQFKSSQILKRILRVPDPNLRRYVLKLFKSQVPYCGRKWRQSNMRVITAIYLECRPDLRDEWLAGMHDSAVEGEVDEAVPLEWALRGLTYWWQKRTYPDVMKLRHKDSEEEGGQEIEDDERDFFQRELDQMGWGVASLGVGDDVAFGEEAPGVNGGASNGDSWDQGINMETWETYT